jgi:transposase-like protein
MNFSQSTLTTFQEAADRFLSAEAQVLKTWQGCSHCPDPGLQLRCQKCPYFIELVLEIQKKLQSEPEQNFPRILPLELEQPYSEELLQQCLELYSQDSQKYSLTEIQRLTGITNRKVLKDWLNSKKGLIKKSKDYSQAERQPSLALYQEGLTPKEIEEITGVSVELLYEWIRQAGISRGHSKYPQELKKECLFLYIQGSSCGQIEALTGVPRGMVGDWVKEANLKKEPRKGCRPPKYSPEVKQACLELVAQGKSASQIEEKMNISAATIRVWLREAKRLTQDPPAFPVIDSDSKDL